MNNDHQPPTDKQLQYLASLSRTRGVRFARPATRLAASRQIAALKAMLSDAVERRLERELDIGARHSGGALAAGLEHEIEGYGSQARWRRNDLGDA